jgi:predicted amidohydrolase
MAPLLGQRERNIQLHLEWIQRARQQGSDLIIFPELSLTGYFLRDMVPEMALTADAPLLCELAQAAGDAALVVGFVEESPGHRFYNAACFAQAGRVVHVHRKVYLPTYGLFDEGRYFARGERVRAFETPAVQAGLRRIGLLVCEDFWHLSAVTIMQAEGVDLLICIANSPARGVTGPKVATSETYDRLCKTYAEMLGAVVIFVNRVGFEDGLCFWGGSMAVGPDARIIAQAPAFDEALVMATIDPEELRRQRLMAPLARDERLLLTLEELKRIKRSRYDR